MVLTSEKDCFIFVLSALRTGTHCSVSDNSEVAGRAQAAWALKSNCYDKNSKWSERRLGWEDWGGK